jgi:hypothetical protein
MDPNTKLLPNKGEPLSNLERYRRLVENLNVTNSQHSQGDIKARELVIYVSHVAEDPRVKDTRKSARLRTNVLLEGFVQ